MNPEREMDKTSAVEEGNHEAEIHPASILC